MSHDIYNLPAQASNGDEIYAASRRNKERWGQHHKAQYQYQSILQAILTLESPPSS